MDLGGLHGFNGSMLDPMRMTDAELLDNPEDEDGDVVNGEELETNSSVLQTPEKLAVISQGSSKNNGPGSEAKQDPKDRVEVGNAPHSGAQITAQVEISPEARAKNNVEMEAKNAEIRSLRETNEKMVLEIRELTDKVDLNEDELTDLREQFMAVDKENEMKSNEVSLKQLWRL